MVDSELEKKIFKLLDKTGIPIRKTVGFSVVFKPNLYNEEYLKDTLEHNLYKPEFGIVPELPFEFSTEEMITIVLKYIYDTTGIKLSKMEQLLTTPSYNGNPFLLLLNEHSFRQKICLAKKTIPGSLILRYNYGNFGFISLGNIEVIRGDFGISDSTIRNLGNLRKIYKDFWVTRYENLLQLESLSPLKEVGGNVTINDEILSSLDTLESVKGNLNLRKSKITNLGNLKYVGGNFLAKKEIFDTYDFSNIDIRGKIKLFKT